MIKNTKWYLYYLIEKMHEHEIAPSVFCDEFYYCYDLELRDNEYSIEEGEVFSNISNISNMFSYFEEQLGSLIAKEKLYNVIVYAVKTLKLFNFKDSASA